jgi:hypothetical protein
LELFGCNAHVKVESTPWNGQNSAVSAPTTVSESNYPVSNGQVIVTMNNMNISSGCGLASPVSLAVDAV